MASAILPSRPESGVSPGNASPTGVNTPETSPSPLPAKGTAANSRGSGESCVLRVSPFPANATSSTKNSWISVTYPRSWKLLWRYGAAADYSSVGLSLGPNSSRSSCNVANASVAAVSRPESSDSVVMSIEAWRWTPEWEQVRLTTGQTNRPRPTITVRHRYRGAAGGEFASRVIGFSCLLLEYGTFDDTSFAIHQMPLDRAAAPGYIGARIRATREGPDLKGARG